MTSPPLTIRPAWNALATHARAMKSRHLRELFSEDPTRGLRLHVEAEGLYFDFSKNLITKETLTLFAELVQESNVTARRDAMFAGEHINTSEDRAVLHVALRMPKTASLVVDGVDVVKEVHGVLERMAAFADQVRTGA